MELVGAQWTRAYRTSLLPFFGHLLLRCVWACGGGGGALPGPPPLGFPSSIQYLSHFFPFQSSRERSRERPAGRTTCRSLSTTVTTFGWSCARLRHRLPLSPPGREFPPRHLPKSRGSAGYCPSHKIFKANTVTSIQNQASPRVFCQGYHPSIFFGYILVPVRYFDASPILILANGTWPDTRNIE